MDPTTTFCPNLDCPTRAQAGQGHIRIHSRQDQRFLCTECHKTFSATKGTACYRLQTSAETVPLVVTLLAHGCPLQAIVVAFGFDERTVTSWLTRAGVQGQAVQDYLVEQPRDLGQVQPAMAAGITDHCWTVRELLSVHVPPPRWTPPKRCGRRSRALHRLIERWGL